IFPKKSSISPSPYFLIILVDARHLDYSDGCCLLRTLVKHPNGGSKNSDVGHAWIYLQGIIDGNSVVLEGGHSGELGIYQPRYFEGIMNYFEYGYANPISLQRQCPGYEPDPVKYLWEVQKDGFFQKGSGGHCPTFAVKFHISESQFMNILRFIEAYDFSQFSLVGNQCCTFAAQIAELGGIALSHTITVPIQQKISMGRDCITLWNDSAYSAITLSSPDILEKSLIETVQAGNGEYALEWYKTLGYTSKCLRCRIKKMSETLSHFPSRYRRALLFRCIQCTEVR
ncbi:MAG TPA: hypothetical protein VIH61_08280, partial [Waddliaceae bacterium]